MTRRLSDLIHGLSGERVNFREVSILGIACDSRKVQSGFLFVAVPGTKIDGYRYIEEAVDRGAVAVVCEKNPPKDLDVPVFRVPSARAAMAELASRLHGKPTHRLNVIGITGTNGKSTSAILLKSILEASGQKVGLLGTIAYCLGDRNLPAPVTTPGADDLQAYFAEMVKVGCQSAVMEVSSHALDQDRVMGIRFAAGIFTNLTRDHIDYHVNLKEYRKAKAKLFEMLPERAIAVLNADDPTSRSYVSKTVAKVVKFGLKKKSEVSAKIEDSSLNGTSFLLKLGKDELRINSRLVGGHNVSNMLAAAACAWSMGFDFEHIRSGLEQVLAIPGRLEVVDGGQAFSVLVDYAHTDDALSNVLRALRPLVKGRILLVFGCGGERDRGKRPKMGKVAEELSDLAIITSDNPRSEKPLDIIKQIEAGMPNKSRYLIEPDRRAAIKLAISLAHRDDAVLIAGKGHETVQIFEDGPRPFDDREVAYQLLREVVKHGS